MTETYVHNFKVKHEQDVEQGIIYLRDDLDAKEARVFFDQARLKKSAEFEDDQDRQFTLVYNGDLTYTLVKRAY
jgi:hypothetical protein